ncbi:MAG: hypothetical protein WC455_29775 [Dehalococcoidia bacterium]|jgi:hypothetical protein
MDMANFYNGIASMLNDNAKQLGLGRWSIAIVRDGELVIQSIKDGSEVIKEYPFRGLNFVDNDMICAAREGAIASGEFGRGRK